MKALKILGGLALGLVLAIGIAASQTSYFPMPSGVGTTGQVLVFTDDNNVQGTHALTASGSLTVGAAGTALGQVSIYTATLDPANVAGNACAEEAFTVTGVGTTDLLTLHAPALSGVAAISARVSGANTVAITFCNPFNGASDAASGGHTFIAVTPGT